MPEKKDETTKSTETPADFTTRLETAVEAQATLDAELKAIDEWYKSELDEISEARNALIAREGALHQVSRDLRQAARKRYNEVVGVEDDAVRPGVRPGDGRYYDEQGYLRNSAGYRIDQYGTRI